MGNLKVEVPGSDCQEVRFDVSRVWLGHLDLNEFPGDVNVQALLRAIALVSNFQDVLQRQATEQHQETPEECKFSGSTSDLVSQKPWHWGPTIWILPSPPGDPVDAQI